MRYIKYIKLKILSMTLIGILIVGGFGTFASSNHEDTFVKKDTIECSEPKLSVNGEYCSIKLAEVNTYLQNPGRPALPVIIKTFTFPIGTIISDVFCQPENIQEKRISRCVGYASKPVPLYLTNKKFPKITPDANIYHGNTEC